MAQYLSCVYPLHNVLGTLQKSLTAKQWRLRRYLQNRYVDLWAHLGQNEVVSQDWSNQTLRTLILGDCHFWEASYIFASNNKTIRNFMWLLKIEVWIHFWTLSFIYFNWEAERKKHRSFTCSFTPQMPEIAGVGPHKTRIQGLNVALLRGW